MQWSEFGALMDAVHSAQGSTDAEYSGMLVSSPEAYVSFADEASARAFIALPQFAEWEKSERVCTGSTSFRGGVSMAHGVAEIRVWWGDAK